MMRSRVASARGFSTGCGPTRILTIILAACCAISLGSGGLGSGGLGSGDLGSGGLVSGRLPAAEPAPPTDAQAGSSADPKTSDPKTSDPKTSDPKTSDRKASDPKTAEPKASGPKATTGAAGRAVQGAPPWAGARGALPSPDRVAPMSRKDALGLFGIDESQLAGLFDGNSLNEDDEDALVRILFRAPQIRLDDIQRWLRRSPPWEEVAQQPKKWRTEFLEIRGRAVLAEKRELLPEVRELFAPFRHYYRVRIQLQDSPHVVVLCARRIPSAWPLDKKMNERVRASGLFLKVGGALESGDKKGVELVCSANRVAWLPDAQTQIAGVTKYHVALGSLGMDVGLFDNVRQRNGRRMAVPDRECFYQLLNAVDQPKAKQLLGRGRALRLPELLQTPQKQHGHLLSFRGTARRITRVVVSDPDIRQRFGIREYFQVEVFISLGDQTLVVKRGKDSKAAPVYSNGFPVVACVRRLPPQLSDLNERLLKGKGNSELLREDVQLTAFFFKLWTYRSEYTDAFGKEQQQLAPLLVGLPPQMAETPPLRSPYQGTWIAVLFIGALAIIWIAVWRTSRRDRQFERERLIGSRPKVQPGALDDLEAADDEPDFSNLP